MTDLPSIDLPPDLLPSDGRFGSGPGKIRREAQLELGISGTNLLGTSHRRPPIRRLVGDIRTALTELYELPHGYEVLLGNGGATAFWDAAAFGLIERRSQHLTFGEFSSKFAAVTSGAPHLDEPALAAAEAGTRPDFIPDGDCDTHALTHNETSTGVTMPIERRGAPGLIMVDATSAAGAMLVDPAAFDAYYFSPQKALGSEGGLWLAMCSPKAIERIESVTSSRWQPPSLDLHVALTNSRKDQTYNTPAIATLFLLQRQLGWMADMGGLSWAAKRSAQSSSFLYAWAEASEFATPFVRRPEDRSTTVVTIDLDDTISADAMSGVLRANGIVDTESYRKLGRNQLRIATFPNIDPVDVERLTEAIDVIAGRL